jgi:hypothetical protein
VPVKTEPDLILYFRPDCHLCDVAARMLEAAGARWRSIDIDGDAELAERYGVLIPVVRSRASGLELRFPFDAETLARFLDG